MTSTYTSNYHFENQGTGDNAGTWGPKLNGNMTLLDSILGSGLTVSTSSTNIVLTQSQASNLYIIVTGTLTNNVAVVFPAIGGMWILENQTSGAFSLSARPAGAGTQVAVPQGGRALVYSDAANIRRVDENIPAGTTMLFVQSAAPVGWTKSTSYNDVALRLTSGSITAGGSVPFSATFAGGIVGGTAITEAQMPYHTHGVSDPGHFHGPAAGSQFQMLIAGSNAPDTIGGSTQTLGAGNTGLSATGISLVPTGGSTAHTHTMPNLQYLDVIMAVKN